MAEPVSTRQLAPTRDDILTLVLKEPAHVLPPTATNRFVHPVGHADQRRSRLGSTPEFLVIAQSFGPPVRNKTPLHQRT